MNIIDMMKKSEKIKFKRPFFSDIKHCRESLINIYGLFDPHTMGDEFPSLENLIAADIFWPAEANFEDFLYFAFTQQADFSDLDADYHEHYFSIERCMLTFFADKGSAPYDFIKRNEWVMVAADHFIKTGGRLKYDERHLKHHPKSRTA